MTENTTIWVHTDDRELLRDAASEMFGTRDVPYKTTIRHLVAASTEVEVDVYQ